MKGQYKLHLVSLIANALQMVRLLATRGHWTIDLLVGVGLGISLSGYVIAFDRVVERALRERGDWKEKNKGQRKTDGGEEKRGEKED